MAAIADAVLLAHCDRLARQKVILQDALAQLSASGSHGSGVTHFMIAANTKDYDVVAPVVEQWYELDENMTISNVVAAVTYLTRAVTALEDHFSAVGVSGGLNAQLAAQGLRVSEHYADVFYLARNTNLDAAVVFKQDAVTMGTLVVTAPGSGTFTDGSALGSGSGAYSSTNMAAQNLEVVVTDQVIGGVNLVLNITCKKADTTTEVKQVTVTAGSAVGTVFPIGTSSDEYIDVTAISVSAGGTAGDTVIVRQVVQRPIHL